ncbi:S9 family peptidase [Oxalobacteraceae bacterium]|nr:S9 family peptidase [Oxalobacteraceae bacterium]
MSFAHPRALRTALIFLCALGAGHAVAADTAPAQNQLPPIASFFSNSNFGGALLSPSGKYLAVKVGLATGAVPTDPSIATHDRLAVIELSSNAIRIVAQFQDADIGNVQWVNNERLVYNATDNSLAPGDVRYAPGLFAVNADGSGFRRLARRNASLLTRMDERNILPWHTYMFSQRGSQDSDSIIVRNVQFNDREIQNVSLLRLNTVTGRSTELSQTGDAKDWWLDQQGVPRLSTSVDQDIRTIHYLDPATAEWRDVAKFNHYRPGKNSFTPLGFGADGILYVRARGERDKAALYTFDLLKNKLSDAPLFAIEEFDFNGSVIMDGRTLLGVRYRGEAVDTLWFDPGMKALQAEIDAQLPNTINLLSAPVKQATPWLLIESYSDVQPSNYLLYNREKKTFRPIGGARPTIVPAQMSPQQLVHYRARDGRSIPAWLTLPAAQNKNLPMVVLAHDGPFARGNSWGWDARTQFLASRGYAVLEPEYRGSAGRGLAHMNAGYKQWGLKMQDDLADGTRWAIAEGYADPARICIAGAGYGGYATLMGLIKDPELYRCGIDWRGVTDIKLLYTGSWLYTSDISDGSKQYAMPVFIGDPLKDAEQLKATSPLLLADKLKQPLLMAYGGADKLVPLNHGLKFRDAVQAHNKQVEWIEYPEEGHGWSLPATRIDFWTRVEKFLARNIGTP